MLRGVRTLRALVVAALVASGCTVEDLDPAGKSCPCPQDLVCDPASNTCVHSVASASSSATSSSSSGSGGAASCAGACGDPGCGDCPDTKVVAVDDWDIDATEVTAARYQAFLDAKVDPATQQPYCLWNQTFDFLIGSDPATGCEAPPDITQFPNVPAVCLDWCDAAAYCAWTKRHLCGRIGGGKLPDEQAGDPTKSQWHRACTKGGTRAYPYGDTFDATLCNTMGSPWGGTFIDVGEALDCQGGYDGLLDMSGNIEEWEDACGDGPTTTSPRDDNCPIRGGAYWTDDVQSRCDSLEYAPHREDASHDWGFRCCGGPL